MENTEDLKDLPTPCFVVDIDRVKNNARQMQETCCRLGLQLRPHMKTHKTLEGAIIQTNGSKECIAVSTLMEAEYYTENGFDDILLAHPLSENKIKRCLALVKKLKKFHVLVSNLSGLEALKKSAHNLPGDKLWSIMLEIDAGYNRSGFYWDSNEIIKAVDVVENSPTMHLDSLYIHCGNAYDVDTSEGRKSLQGQVIERAQVINTKLGKDYLFGTGSTPTCSIPDEGNSFFYEFHPGNYIFYDYQQYLLGGCRQRDIAGRVMTRVVDHKPRQHRLIVDCGFTALSHDGMRQRPLDFCLVEGDSNLRMIGMSQELGKIEAKEGELDCEKYPIGTIFFLIPYHSCATAAMHPQYFVHSGQQLVATWQPCRGW